MASMIAENSYLIPSWVRKDYDLKDRYLLVVTDMEQESAAAKDPIVQKINAMKKKLYSRLDKIDEANAERKDFEDKVVKALAKLKGNQDLLRSQSSLSE
jgi:plasmid maintenance system killer protein